MPSALSLVVLRRMQGLKCELNSEASPMTITARPAHKALRQLGTHLQQARRKHALAVGGAVALVAGSLSALAVAVAPLAPDPAQWPQQLVTVPVESLPVIPQLEALAAQPLVLNQTVVVRGPDTLHGLLRRAGVQDGSAVAALVRDAAVVDALKASGARSFEVRTTAEGALEQLTVRMEGPKDEIAPDHFRRVTVRRGAEGWVSTVESAPLTRSVRFAGGTIRHSLFGATDDAGLPDTMAIQLAEIFSGDIDFHRELRKGDTFHVAYEALYADGEPIAWDQGTGRVLGATFDNAGDRYEAYWFESGDKGKGAYYDAQGRSRKRAFLASPLAFSRVTSGFAMRRHPILKTWRAHTGVDYAAPTGTPVRVVSDGIVRFAGWRGGYGQVVEIEHSQNRSTLYAHLSRIAVRKGARVQQGDNIGSVGSTGMSTGPHLHFELRVAGVHQDPQRLVKHAEQRQLDKAQLRAFADQSQALKAGLETAQEAFAQAGPVRFE
jgi:murein DD-endopeptidase MepM/ murein hydrolase activator NlpD